MILIKIFLCWDKKNIDAYSKTDTIQTLWTPKKCPKIEKKKPRKILCFLTELIKIKQE